jgi:glycosyltransferase involved in cell wall biosynthesis
MILKLYGDKNNTGGIVNFQNSIATHSKLSKNKYKHYRTGKKQKSKFLSIPIIRVIDQLLSYCYYPLYLLSVKPDVVEINSSLVPSAFKRDFIYAKITKFIRPKAHLVLFNHGWNYEFKNTMLKQNRNLLISYFTIFDSIIVLAKVFKIELKEELGINQDKIKIITTGINLSEYKNYTIHQKKKNRFNVLFLSRIEKTKGIEEFLKAIPIVLKKHPETHFDIAGTGSFLDEVKTNKIILKYKQSITLCGYVRDIKKLTLFKNSDIFAFPSYYGEGCPVSVLEAVAVGLPIIYTRVGALPDLLSDKENGICISKKNENDLALAILKLIEDSHLRREISNNNLVLSKLFDLKIIHDQLEKIYKNK